MAAPLFACSKCFSRHPFEELSQGQQLCKECRGSFPIVKCTYCRSEFQQGSKSSTAAVCKKCESMVKQYGKPSACDYCNVIASFIGKKCARCTNAEKKFGPPTTCEQCKQKCAFDRKDDDKKKVDGKILCWLCTLSYKRALARTKVTDPGRNSRVKLTSNVNQHKEKERNRLSGHNKRPNRPDVTKIPLEESPAKVAKVTRTVAPKNEDANSSEQMALTSQLREQISRLEKQFKEKKTQMLEKDKQIHDMRASNFTMAQEERVKTRNLQRDFEAKLEKLQLKIRDQNKEIAQLSKGKRKSKGPEIKVADKEEPDQEAEPEPEPAGVVSSVSSATEGGSSGTDSPVVS